ncbi:MAG: NYN domain-containing protein [Acidobacteria bacterium]|nr:NYN domain-containing protein [Acidobacteriota bacterium]
MAESDRLRIAVFIDFDNIEIGVKNTLGASFDAGLVLEALKERGEVVSKTAYSDWQRAGGYSRALTQHAIRMVQRNMTPGGDKNGADINLALDALEMAFTHPHINAFVIVGGDSDFISLVEKLKQYDKKVFIVGGRQFTSVIMQRNCHEFVAYENLLASSGVSQPAADRRHGGGREVRVERSPIEQAIPLVSRALKVLSEREVSPQLGLLKSTLLQLDSTFSERNYGAGSFRDFVQKLEKVGVVKVHHGKGGLLVELAEGVQTPQPPAERAAAPAEESEAAAAPPLAAGAPAAEQAGSRQAPPEVIGTAADGLRAFRDLLARAAVRRWPMYLRNVKQVIRQTSPEFDERSYGFANLTDLLRAAHRENIVRVDRDRQGVIRVFQGSTPVPSSQEEATPEPAVFDVETEEAPEAREQEIVERVVVTEIDVPVFDVAYIEEAVSLPEIDVTPYEASEDRLPGDVDGNRAEPSGGRESGAASSGRKRRPRTRPAGGSGRTTARAPKSRARK